MTNPWTWFKNLFRPKAAKKNEKTIRDIAKRRSLPNIPASSLHNSRTSDVVGDVLDVASTVLLVDAVTDLVGRSESVDVPPQPTEREFLTVASEYPQADFDERIYSTVVATPDPAPVFNDTASTTFNDTSSFTFGSSTPAAVDEDSMLTTVFSGIGDAVSGIGDAIGSVLSD